MNYKIKNANKNIFNKTLKMAKYLCKSSNQMVFELSHYIIDNLIGKICMDFLKTNNLDIFKNKEKGWTNDFPVLLKDLLNNTKIDNIEKNIIDQHNKRNYYQHGKDSYEYSLNKEHVKDYISLAENLMKELNIYDSSVKFELKINKIISNTNQQINKNSEKEKIINDFFTKPLEYFQKNKNLYDYYHKNINFDECYICIIPSTYRNINLKFNRNNKKSLIENYLKYNTPIELPELYPIPNKLKIDCKNGTQIIIKKNGVCYFRFVFGIIKKRIIKDDFYGEEIEGYPYYIRVLNISNINKEVDQKKYGLPFKSIKRNLIGLLKILLFMFSDKNKKKLTEFPTINFKIGIKFSKLIINSEPRFLIKYSNWGNEVCEYKGDDESISSIQDIEFSDISPFLTDKITDIKNYFLRKKLN